MIGRPRPATPQGRALAYIATADGDVSPEILADHLYPPVRRSSPFASSADYKAWREARTESNRQRRDRASRLIRQLTEGGYIEGRGGPRVADWFVRYCEAHGLTRALALASPGLRSVEDGPGVLHAKIVAAMVANPPPTVEAAIGARPSGRTTEVWADLCRWGVVVPASARYLTAKGAEVVASWATP